VSCEEAGLLFGFTADAMRKRARRLGWRVQRNNDGLARVLVPEGVALHSDGRSGRPGGHPAGHPDGQDNLQMRLGRAEGEVAGLREALRNAEEGRLAAQAKADREAMARVATEAMLADQQERAAHAEGEAEGLLEALRIAEAQAAVLQTDVDRERTTAQVLMQAEVAERQAAETARAELSAWTAGRPLTRALRAFFRRR
jgi:hypothetical protein